jgi:hypothetical protein
LWTAVRERSTPNLSKYNTTDLRAGHLEGLEERPG